MKLKSGDKKLAGVAVPVFSLRTKHSCGIGEFLDLIPFAQWCKKAGLAIIQILPINDTGNSSSPYSANSAFALNPVYLCLEAIAGMENYRSEMETFRLKQGTRLDYPQVYNFKYGLLRKWWKEHTPANSESLQWKKENPWVSDYAEYMCKTGGAEGGEEFYVHVQYELSKQLKKVKDSLQNNGIILKGDIPILMGEGSADVADNPQIFDKNYSAGAPPDMFSDHGQNWGFPVYNWEEIKKSGYDWWKKRLLHFSGYFSAVRLDHVIGFLRIWRIPRSDQRGTGGHFFPSAFLNSDDIPPDFTEEEKQLLIAPLISRNSIQDLLGEKFAELSSIYLQDTGNGFYRLKQEFDSEKIIQSIKTEGWIKEVLINIHYSRIFNAIDELWLSPAWYYYRTEYFISMEDSKKARIQGLIEKFYRESEVIWEHNGREILAEFIKTCDILFCAEDLGAVPESTASILNDLGVLSLKVGRWSRKYQEENQPFIPPNEYPFLSVATTSVHDSSSLRGWWVEDLEGRRKLFDLLQIKGDCPEELGVELQQRILEFYLQSGSAICIFPLQDFLGISEIYRTERADEERINIPGEVNSTNWTWRMPCLVEDLEDDVLFTGMLQKLVESRNP